MLNGVLQEVGHTIFLLHGFQLGGGVCTFMDEMLYNPFNKIGLQLNMYIHG
jgi:hypothetical protein